MGNENKSEPRYEAYQDGNPERTDRCWSVFENDGTIDGRLVGSNMVEEDAARIAVMLNEDWKAKL